jgi:hypothetical protein
VVAPIAPTRFGHARHCIRRFDRITGNFWGFFFSFYAVHFSYTHDSIQITWLIDMLLAFNNDEVIWMYVNSLWLHILAPQIPAIRNWLPSFTGWRIQVDSCPQGGFLWLRRDGVAECL